MRLCQSRLLPPCTHLWSTQVDHLHVCTSKALSVGVTDARVLTYTSVLLHLIDTSGHICNWLEDDLSSTQQPFELWVCSWMTTRGATLKLTWIRHTSPLAYGFGLSPRCSVCSVFRCKSIAYVINDSDWDTNTDRNAFFFFPQQAHIQTLCACLNANRRVTYHWRDVYFQKAVCIRNRALFLHLWGEKHVISSIKSCIVFVKKMNWMFM